MIRFNLIFLFCAPLVLFFSSEFALANNPMKAPYSKRPGHKPPFRQTSTVKFVTKGLINFYSKVVSPADGPRSPSYPTGSEYGRRAIERYGFFMGIILIADRLFHESGESLNPIVNIYGVDRYFDPPENNVFWWKSHNETEK